MPDIKISIIVPVYNSEKYLPETAQSILKQSFSDFELILVDDGSKDGSGKICDQLAAKDTRIKVIHKTNGGICSARNAGLKESDQQSRRRNLGRYLSESFFTEKSD